MTHATHLPDDEHRLFAGISQLAPALPAAAFDAALFATDRQRYERGLLAWLRGADPAGLKIMRDSLERAARHEPDPVLAGFWKLAGINVDTFVGDHSESARLLPAQLARQLKKRGDESQPYSPPVSLARQLWERLYQQEHHPAVEASLALLEIGADHAASLLEQLEEESLPADTPLLVEEPPTAVSVAPAQHIRPTTPRIPASAAVVAAFAATAVASTPVPEPVSKAEPPKLTLSGFGDIKFYGDVEFNIDAASKTGSLTSIK